MVTTCNGQLRGCKRWLCSQTWRPIAAATASHVLLVLGLLLPVTQICAQDETAAVPDNDRDVAALQSGARQTETTERQAVSEAFKQGLNAYLQGDFASAHTTWLPLAEQGDPVAAFNLGVLYARGQGTKTDPARAVYWYRKAADAGYTLAQFNLGAAYMTGQGVEADHNRAAQWWARAAQRGNPQALFNLGTLYLHGDGVPRDQNRALNLIQKAADLGDTRAHAKLKSLQDPTAPPPAALEADAFRPATKSRSVLGTAPAPSADPNKKSDSAEVVASNAQSSLPKQSKSVVPASKPDPEPKSRSKWVVARGDTSPAAQNQPPPATAVSSANNTSVASEPRDSRFLAAADPQGWTVQVSAFKTRSQAEQFIKRHRLHAEAILIQARVKGRVWYKVMHGVYENAQQARHGIDRMSKTLRKRSPWARRIGVVQKELVLQGPAVAPSTTKADAKKPVPKPATGTKRGWRNVPASPPNAEASQGSSVKAPTSAAAVQAPEKVARPVAKPAPAPRRQPARIASARQSQTAAPSAQAQGQFQTGQSAFNNQDYKTAFEIWAPLAAQGVDKAQYGLGFMYESGWGVRKDYLKAYQWYRRAAEQGHAQSQFNLGLLYQAGLGVPKNEALANYWIQSAADRDDPRAKEFLRNLRLEKQR